MTLGQISIATGQRGWKVQPDGGLIGEGSSPRRTMRFLTLKGSATGVAEKQGLGVGMLRFAEDRVPAPRFNRDSQIHDHDLVGDMLDDRQIMADKEIGQIEAFLQVDEEVEDLGLDRDIEGRDRFIEHQDLRIEHQGPGHGDALALPAGKHMGIAVVVLGPQTDQGQHILGRLAALIFGLLRVDEQGFFQGQADFLARIERAVGVLKDDLHPGAPDATGGLVGM